MWEGTGDLVEMSIKDCLCMTEAGIIVAVGGKAVSVGETVAWWGDNDTKDAGIRLRELGGSLVGWTSGWCHSCLQSLFRADTVELAPLINAKCNTWK